MKKILLAAAALLPLIPAGNAPAEPKPLPWVLAQRTLASCELDNRKVPSGTKVCSTGYVMECGPNGTWQNTGTAC